MTTLHKDTEGLSVVLKSTFLLPTAIHISCLDFFARINFSLAELEKKLSKVSPTSYMLSETVVVQRTHDVEGTEHLFRMCGSIDCLSYATVA